MFVLRFACLLAAVALPAQDFAARFEQIKRQASPAQLHAFLYDMPKGGDLHHHVGLSAWPEEWWTAMHALPGRRFLVRTKFLSCPDSVEPFLRWATIPAWQHGKLSACAQAEYVEADEAIKPDWLSAMRLDKPGEGRHEFFENVVNRLTGILRDPEVLAEGMALYVKRYGRENLRYLETQFNPAGAFARPDGTPVDAETAYRLVTGRLSRPDVVASGVVVKFQSVAIRFLPSAEQRIEEAYAWVDAHRDWFVGINFAGREDNDKGTALRFLSTFRKMRRKYAGIHLSLHGGEVDSPGSDVRNTLLLGAERIGHGFNLITDPDTLLLLRNGKNLLEVNLVSNRLLEYASDLDQHPFPEYLRFGVPVCLNTDDAGVWDSNLTDEYFTAIKHFNLSWEEIVRLGHNSLEYAFAPDPVKRDRIERFKQAIALFEQKYATGNWQAKLAAVRPEVSGYARRTFFQ